MNTTRYRALSVRILPLLAVLFLMLLQTTAVHAQTTITGTVSDEGGTPLPGTNVTIKGSTSGTTTNQNGQYAIAASANDVLVFSFVGFVTQEITVGQRTVINVRMVAAGVGLEGVARLAQGVRCRRRQGAGGGGRARDVDRCAGRGR